MLIPRPLTLLVALPLLAAAALLPIPARRRDALVAVALGLALLTLGVALAVAIAFDGGSAALQFVERAPWIPSLGVEYAVGVDGLSLFPVLLATLLFAVAVGTADAEKEGLKGHLIALFALETACIGAFVALDLALFYCFLELALLPSTLLLFGRGGARKEHAGMKRFLFMTAGSLPMLFALIALPYLHYLAHGAFTTDLLRLHGLPFPSFRVECLLFLCFCAAFAVRLPLVPFHTWLTDAHAEAPTGGSLLLAGVLLPLGGYGFLRFAVPLFPAAAAFFAPWFMALGAAGVILGACVAMVRTDLKRLVACLSVSHMGYVAVGLFALNEAGIAGASLHMINHGLFIAALFLLVGALERRRGSRLLRDFGGVAPAMPRFAGIFLAVTLAAVCLPGLNGFVGWLLCLVGAYRHSFLAGLACTAGALLLAGAMLRAVERLLFGPPAKAKGEPLSDLTTAELVPFAPLLALCLLLGVYPALVTDRMAASVAHLANHRATYLLEVAGGTTAAPARNGEGEAPAATGTAPAPAASPAAPPVVMEPASAAPGDPAASAAPPGTAAPGAAPVQPPAPIPAPADAPNGGAR